MVLDARPGCGPNVSHMPLPRSLQLQPPEADFSRQGLPPLVIERGAGGRPLLAERHFQALIGHSSDVILVVDGRGRLVYASPSRSTLLGYDAGSLLGTPALDLVHPDDQCAVSEALMLARRVNATHRGRIVVSYDNHRKADQLGRTVAEIIPDIWPQIEPVYRQVIETGEAVVNVEVSGPSAGDSDRTHHWLANYCPVCLRDEVIGVGVVAVDITEHTRANEARALLAAIVRSSDDAVFSKSLDGTVLTWNSAATSMLGWNEGEMVGQSVSRLIPAEPLAGGAEILQRVAWGQSTRVSRRPVASLPALLPGRWVGHPARGRHRVGPGHGGGAGRGHGRRHRRREPVRPWHRFLVPDPRDSPGPSLICSP